MKTKHLLLFVLIAAFSSCSVAYRTGQTPDDVYYSPAPPQDEYVTTTNQEDRDSYAYNNTYKNEDLQIRRGIRDPRYRTNVYVDLGFGYNPYDYYNYYNPYVFNPYAYKGIYDPYSFGYPSYGYNNYYSPFTNYYYPAIYYSKYSSPLANYPISPRRYNLGVYNNTSNNTGVNNGLRPATNNNTVPARTFPTKPANTSGVGNFIRRVFTPSNNNTRSSGNNNNYSSDNSSSTRTIQTNTSGSSALRRGVAAVRL